LFLHEPSRLLFGVPLTNWNTWTACGRAEVVEILRNLVR
jgi:uncharacterized membrane protein